MEANFISYTLVTLKESFIVKKHETQTSFILYLLCTDHLKKYSITDKPSFLKLHSCKTNKSYN